MENQDVTSLGRDGHDGMTPPEQALKVEEVAKRLRLSERTVWKYIRSGALPSFKVGNSVRVAERIVDDVINDRFLLISKFYDHDTHERPDRLRMYFSRFAEFRGYLEKRQAVPSELWKRIVDEALGRWTNQEHMTEDQRKGFINFAARAMAEAERLLDALGESVTSPNSDES